MALVAFPIVCLVFVVFVTMSALSDVESKLQEESRSSALIFDTYSMIAKVSDTFIALGLAFGAGDRDCFKTFQTTMRGLEPPFDALIEKLDQGSARHQKESKDLQAMWREMKAETNPAGGTLDLEYLVGSRLAKLVIAVTHKLHEIIASESVINEKEMAATQNSVEKLQQAGKLVVAVSLALTLLLWYLYSVSIEKPLLHLVANGRLLWQGLPLLPALKGADELASLDRLIHEVKNSIDESLLKERESISNAADLICSIDEYGILREANPCIEKLLGYSPDDVIGMSLHELLEDEDAMQLNELLGHVIKATTTYDFVVKMRKKDDSVVDTRWSCLHSPGHESIFCIAQDVTEEIRVQRLKEDFSETVSEDLRLPLLELHKTLAAVLMGESGEIPESIHLVLERTRHSVDRLLFLANDLLDYQRLRGTQLSLNIDTHDLSAIISEAHDCVASLASVKHINIILPSTALAINCDRMRMLQTIVNLLSNAIKFTPQATKIEVKLDLSNDKIILQVIDSGPGIPKVDRERIFLAFEQVSSVDAKQGTGLGLAICKMFVEAHGGTIKADSTDSTTNETVCFSDGTGAGSSFVITLPVSSLVPAAAVDGSP